LTFFPGNVYVRIAAAIFGVSEYTDDTLNADTHKLSFAANDAGSFARYMRAAWPTNTDENLVECWTDRAATMPRWSSSISRIANAKPDLFIAYLAGHAIQTGNSAAAFCLTDTQDENTAVTAAVIDQAFNLVGADVSILFLDCCHAEAVVSGTAFFGGLYGSRARLFLCSARSEQRAWEEATLEHGLFSSAILRGLARSSPVADSVGNVAIDALFALVSEDVPKRAFALKDRAPQEPIRGGLTTAQILLPTASARTLGDPISTYDAVVAGFRRWLVRACLLIAGSVAFTDLTFQHLAIDADGHIVVRSGLPLFNPLRRTLPAGVYQTGFTRGDLVSNAGQTERITALRNGQIVAYRLWKSHSWPSVLAPALAIEPRQRLSILVNGRLEDNAEKLDPIRHAPPFDALNTLLALDPQLDPLLAAEAFDYDLPDVSLRCSESVQNRLDFTVLSPPSHRLNIEIDWRLTLPVSPEDHKTALQKALRIVAYRHQVVDRERRMVREGPDHVTDAEFSRLADWAQSSRYRSYIPDVIGHGSWCSVAENFIAVLSMEEHVSRSGETFLLQLVNTYDPEIHGDLLNPDAQTGLALLSILARHTFLDYETVDSVSSILRTDSRGLGGTPAIGEWLTEIAATTPLPPVTLQFLIDTLTEPFNDPDYSLFLAFRILARNAVHLSNAQRQLLLEWTRANFHRFSRYEPVLDGVAHLSPYLTREEAHDHVSVMASRTDPSLGVDPSATSWRGEMMIWSGGLTNWRSISRIAQHVDLPPTVSDGLLIFAAAAQEANAQHLALRGLANQQPAIRDGDWHSLRRTLAQHPDSASRYALATAAGLHVCRRKTADNDFETLRTMWSKEAVPILRIAIANAIQYAHLCALADASRQ